jgi:hypothetical protein
MEVGTMRYRGTLALTLGILALTTAVAAQRRAGFSGRWLGQDGKDLVGPSSAVAPNDVQDVHIALSGLPKDSPIEWATLQGLGGGSWAYNVQPASWRLAVIQRPGSTTADLYFEPFQVETGRPFTVVVNLKDGRSLEAQVRGGKADPNRRMATATLKVRWLGQDGHDRTGIGPAVGPDGLEDVHLLLSGLSPQVPIQAVSITAPRRNGWNSGTNPDRRHNAELIRRQDDPRSADLFLQPDGDLAGAKLAVHVHYAEGKSDQATVTAGKADPRRAMPPVKPFRLVPNRITARWLGQGGPDQVGPGDVRVELSGLDREHAEAVLALSNSARRAWSYRLRSQGDFTPEPYALPLLYRRRPDREQADLWFPPDRDEQGGFLTVRLALLNGSSTLVRIPGGPCDPGLRAGPPPATSRVVAKPGDSLMMLVGRYGHVQLSRGTYRLISPLVLERPIAVTAEPGAVLEFAQPPDAEPWTAAIKVRAGHTKLEGFAVRFSGPIRWKENISYGPAVIGTTDNLDNPSPHLLADIQLARLDLQAPPSSGRSPWEEATKLIRLAGATCGRVHENTLRGGTVEFFGGPWSIVKNQFLGTPAGTFSQAVFAGHDTHDVTIRDNQARSEPSAGKTWRFLVLTGSGVNDVVEHNRVSGIGPRDVDTIPGANAPEIILTESYRLHFEGKPAAISHEGRILQIPEPQGDPAGTGSIVAILSGPKAGTWHRVAQAIDPRTLLVDPPLPMEDYAVSVVSGFVNETFQGNTVEARGGSVAVNLVLAGNHFGTKVLDNHFIGAGEAFRIMASASESPCGWGWSHAPMFGIQVEGNTIEDSPKGGQIAVEQGPAVKSSAGRVYYSGTVRKNRGVYTEAFLSRERPESLAAIVLGDPAATDPGQLAVTEGENATRTPRRSAPIEASRIHAATVNGRPVTTADKGSTRR